MTKNSFVVEVTFKIKISDNCFNFIGDRSLGTIFFSCFWILFHDSTALTVIEYFSYQFVKKKKVL